MQHCTHNLTLDLWMLQALAVLSANPIGNTTARHQHSFLLRRGLSSQTDGFSLESEYAPGNYLVSGIPVGRGCRTASAPDVCAKSEYLFRFPDV
jgi:hypothetical protein